MNRKIKFRAWDKQLKEITEVVCLNLGIYSTDHILKSKNHPNCYNQVFENIVLMQFTGLKDRNGKDVYEGDIVKEVYKGKRIWEDSNTSATVIQEPFGEVYYATTPTFNISLIRKGIYKYDSGEVFENLHMNHYDGSYSWTSCELEIIGNIYENPELLKEGGDEETN